MGNCISDYKLSKRTLENTPFLTFTGKTFRGKVIDVYDGDTMTIAILYYGDYVCVRCRLEGIDCPEIRTKNAEEKEKGLKARNYVKDLLLNRIVTMVCSDNKDKYDRVLARLILGRTDISQHLIENGYGKPYDGGRKQ